MMHLKIINAGKVSNQVPFSKGREQSRDALNGNKLHETGARLEKS